MTPSPTRQQLLGNPTLSAIRAALVIRMEAAHERHRHTTAPGEETVPSSLFYAACWLVNEGWDGETCRAERLNNWSPRRYRMFLDGLGADTRAAVIESGRKALFEGTRRLAAVFAIVDADDAAPAVKVAA